MKGSLSAFAMTIMAVLIVMLLINTYKHYTFIQGKPYIGNSLHGIVIDNDIAGIMNNKFQTTPDHEFVVCLTGYKNGSMAMINGYFYPDQEPIEYGVSASPCRTEPGLIEYMASFIWQDDITFGSVHNHANGVCRPSETDVFTFGHNDDYIMGIICNTDTVTVYTPDSLSESIPVSIQEI